MKLSVVIPTHRPQLAHLHRVLAALDRELRHIEGSECVLVDNGNSPPLSAEVLGRAYPWLRIVREDRLGSANARATGFLSSRGQVIATLDDDTVPDENYCHNGLRFLQSHPKVGAVGGKIVAEFEQPPPAHFAPNLHLFGIRDHGDEPLVHQPVTGMATYPYFAPLGIAFFRAPLVQEHARRFRAQTSPATPGRVGRDSVGGCEDCEVVMSALLAGYEIAYSPTLRVTHLIPATRMSAAYLRRLAHGSGIDWARFQVRHGLASNQRSGFLRLVRLAKHYIRLRGWTCSGRISWEAYRGHLKGLVQPPPHDV